MEINKEILVKAIAKVIAAQSTEVSANRKKEFKCSFELKGDVNIKQGEDFTQVHNFSIDWEKAFLFALNKLNHDSAYVVLREFLSNPDVEVPKEFKKRVGEITKEIKGTSSKAMAGKVTVNAEMLTEYKIDICENC